MARAFGRQTIGRNNYSQVRFLPSARVLCLVPAICVAEAVVFSIANHCLERTMLNQFSAMSSFSSKSSNLASRSLLLPAFRISSRCRASGIAEQGNTLISEIDFFHSHIARHPSHYPPRSIREVSALHTVSMAGRSASSLGFTYLWPVIESGVWFSRRPTTSSNTPASMATVAKVRRCACGDHLILCGADR